MTWIDMDPGDPYAEIVKHDRWSWYITVHHGIHQWGPDGGGWFSFGSRDRAERKARRLLRKYELHEARRRDVTRISAQKERTA